MKRKRKLRLREWVKNVIGVTLFYLMIIGGVILADARWDDLCNEGYTQYCDVEKGDK